MCILYKHVFICVQKVTIKNLISKIYFHNILQKVTKRSKMVITNSSCCWCFDPLQIFKEHGQSSSIFLGLNFDHFLFCFDYSSACLARHIWASIYHCTAFLAICQPIHSLHSHFSVNVMIIQEGIYSKYIQAFFNKFWTKTNKQINFYSRTKLTFKTKEQLSGGEEVKYIWFLKSQHMSNWRSWR